jgi:class 3 adenylate cyclase
LPQEITSSNLSSHTLEIWVLVVILFGGIVFIVLMMKRKRVSEMPRDSSAETAAPGVLPETIADQGELETGSVGVGTSGREDETADAPPASPEQEQRSPEKTDRAERHLAAILAADIVGYSRRMEQDEVGTLRRLRDLHRNLIEPKIAEYRGRIFKTMGDGFLAEFGSVVDAVHCAVDLQRMMAGRNLDLPEEDRVSLRVGVNLGDVFREGEDVFGDGVNIAARLESIAPPGGIYISRAACDPIRERLAFDFEDLGARQVKNITRPIHVFNVRIGGLAEAISGENRFSRRD